MTIANARIHLQLAATEVSLAMSELAGLVDTDPIPQPKTTLRVVQWNTHHGGVPIDATGANKPLNVQGITDWLIKFEPDIVCLNELEELDGYGNLDQLDYHRAALERAQGVPWYASFCSMSGGAKRLGGGVGVLTKNPQIVLTRHSSESRPMFYVHQPVDVMSLHLTSDSSASRVIEAADFMSWLKQFPTDRLLVCGDFNAVPSAPEMKDVLTFFRDVWVDAKALGKATSFLPGDGVTHGVHHIDYVLYRGMSVVSCDIPDTSTNGVFPSDHHPVVATFAA